VYSKPLRKTGPPTRPARGRPPGPGSSTHSGNEGAVTMRLTSSQRNLGMFSLFIPVKSLHYLFIIVRDRSSLCCCGLISVTGHRNDGPLPAQRKSLKRKLSQALPKENGTTSKGPALVKVEDEDSAIDSNYKIKFRQRMGRPPESQVSATTAVSALPAKLLPERLFKHIQFISDRQLWTEAKEERLQHDEAEACRKASRTSVDWVEERKLWNLMITDYNCIPADLFRYGLKLEPAAAATSTAGNGTRITDAPVHPSFANLTKLLCHPAWRGDVALVRWALQKAIACRVACHIHPIAACVDFNTDADDSIIDVLMEASKQDPHSKIREIANYCYRQVAKHGPQTDPTVRAITTWLEANISVEVAEEKVEEELFYLQDRDLQAVMDALDAQMWHGQPMFRLCKEYMEIHNRVYKAASSQPINSDDELADCKAECLLHEKREERLRRAFRLQGLGDMLLDFPHRDSPPYHVWAREVSSAQRRVMAGVVRHRKEESLPAGPTDSEISDLKSMLAWHDTLPGWLRDPEGQRSKRYW
jgi:hypothetical protein